MKSKWVSKTLAYEGEPLSSLWAYKKFKVQGDSIVSFRGPCHVDVDALVDIEDVLQKAEIHSDDMLHFIVEHFDLDLPNMILRQRLLMSIAADILKQYKTATKLFRTGDDLYLADKKLSVSIATLTPVSSKIHIGLNISSKNTPVKTVGLSDLKIAYEPFARQLMNAYVSEHRSMMMARAKVRAAS